MTEVAKTKIKQVFGFALAALLTLALTPLAAFADGETPTQGTSSNTKGTITIDNAVPGQTYTLYKIMDLESFDADKGHYSYTPAEGWEGFLKSQRVDIVNGYVVWTGMPEDNSTAIKQFADAAIDFAKGNSNAIGNNGQAVADSSTVAFNDLPLGYYLVDSSLGTLCSLTTTNPKVTIKEKNPEPTLTKEVQENSLVDDSEGGWHKKNDANIGDTVNFKVTIDAKSGAAGYVMHDTMSKGLAFDATSVKVVRTSPSLEEPVELTADQFAVITDAKDGCTFEVSFDQIFCNTLTDDDDLIVTYSATLTSEAEVSGTGNANEAYLKYGEEAKKETEPSVTKTYTWAFGVFKHDESGAPLGDAVFKLTTDEEGDNSVLFTQVGNVLTVDENGAGEFTPLANESDQGRVMLRGLDAGTYYLHEVSAPAGYNMLAGPIKVTITTEGDGDDELALICSIDGAGEDTVLNIPTVDVENRTGGLLPSTGGIGTTILYVVGGVLIVGALVFLVVRRRQSAK